MSNGNLTGLALVVATLNGCACGAPVSERVALDLCDLTRSYPVVLHATPGSVSKKSSTDAARFGVDLSEISLSAVEQLRADESVISGASSSLRLGALGNAETFTKLFQNADVDRETGFYFGVRRDRDEVWTCESCIFWRSTETGRIHNAERYQKDGIDPVEFSAVWASDGVKQLCPPEATIPPEGGIDAGEISLAPDAGE